MLRRFEIQSVSEGGITGAFALDEAAFVRATAVAAQHEAAYESRECECVGRVYLENLLPATDYTVTLWRDDAALAVENVRTLPAPMGAKRAEFVIIADTHITLGREMRRGRLFMEAEAVLRQCVAEINRSEADFVLLPGDVTNGGYPEEMERAAEILRDLRAPLLMVPGDHDLQAGASVYGEFFGDGDWVERRKGLTLVGCHIQPDYSLGPRTLENLFAAAEGEGPLLLVAHRQLIPDDYVKDANRVYVNHAEYADALAERLPRGALAYVGHKNLPAQHIRSGLLQLNVPQPVQYPCGTLRVRRYENGFYHTVEPLFSEVLNEYSRVRGNSLGVDLWEESYRRGHGPHLWNFVWDPERAEVVG